MSFCFYFSLSFLVLFFFFVFPFQSSYHSIVLYHPLSMKFIFGSIFGKHSYQQTVKMFYFDLPFFSFHFSLISLSWICVPCVFFSSSSRLWCLTHFFFFFAICVQQHDFPLTLYYVYVCTIDTKGPYQSCKFLRASGKSFELFFYKRYFSRFFFHRSFHMKQEFCDNKQIIRMWVGAQQDKINVALIAQNWNQITTRIK